MFNQQKACTEHPKLPKNGSLLPDVSVIARTQFSGGTGTSEELFTQAQSQDSPRDSHPPPAPSAPAADAGRDGSNKKEPRVKPSFPKPEWES